jgi:CBS domain-containing protein
MGPSLRELNDVAPPRKRETGAGLELPARRQRSANPHQGFPIVDGRGVVIGVLTRRDLQPPPASETQTLRELIMRNLKFVYDDCTVRHAAEHMVNHNIRRLTVVRRQQPYQLVGMLTRSGILSAYRGRIEQDEAQRPAIRVSRLSKKIRGIPTRLFR